MHACMQVLESVAGSWRLLYSSSISTLALLATSRLPLLSVGDYVQTVDAAAMSVVDKARGAWHRPEQLLCPTATAASLF